MTTRDREAMEKARATAPCWGDGIAGPKDCDESFDCALHERIAKALLEFAEEAVKEAEEAIIKNMAIIEDMRRDHACKEAHASGHAEALEKAAKVFDKYVGTEGNTGRTLLDIVTIQTKIRALLPTGVKDV